MYGLVFQIIYMTFAICCLFVMQVWDHYLLKKNIKLIGNIRFIGNSCSINFKSKEIVRSLLFY